MANDRLPLLRAQILRFFLSEAEQIGSLLALPEMQPHNRRRVKRLVYALYHAGLLERWGATSGTTYRTSHLGFVVLVTLDEALTHKRHRHSQDEVS